MVDLEMIEELVLPKAIGEAGSLLPSLIAEIRELRQKCADLASGDPAVRMVLLREFGTTDPALLQQCAQDRHQHIRELFDRGAKLRLACERLMAFGSGGDDNGPLCDQWDAAVRFAEDAIRPECPCEPQPVTFVSEECSEELKRAFASLPPDSGQIQVLPAGITYEPAGVPSRSELHIALLELWEWQQTLPGVVPPVPIAEKVRELLGV